MAATGGGSQGANRFGFGAAGAPSPTPFLGVGDSPAAQKSAPDGDGATTMETEGSEGGTPARSNRGSAVDAPPGLDRADVFSLGATAYELARGAALPSGGEAYQALRRGEMDPLDARAFGSAFRAVVAGMLRENPAARPSAAEVKAGAAATARRSGARTTGWASSLPVAAARPVVLAAAAAATCRRCLSCALQSVLESRPTSSCPAHSRRFEEAAYDVTYEHALAAAS